MTATTRTKFAPLDEALKDRGLHLHYTTWLRLIRVQGLPAVKIGGRYYIDPDDLDAWIASRRDARPAAQTVASAATPRTMTPTAAATVLGRRRRARR